MTTVTSPRMAVDTRVARWVRVVVIAAIRLYQYGWSSRRPPSCRYLPTCSDYAVESVNRFGPVLGSYYALRRLLRCAPWGSFGFDPVPDRAGPQGTPRPGALVAPCVAIVVSQTG